MSSFLRSARHRISHLTPPLLKEKVRKAIDDRFPELDRLRNLPRREPTTTDLLGPPTRLTDADTFVPVYEAVFEKEIYAFETEREEPRIIDGGANVGLATLYWKRQFPGAKITAFEPGPEVFQALEYNIQSHGLENVDAVQAGLWDEEGAIEFEQDKASSGHFSQFPGTDSVGSTKVSVTRLGPYLDQHIDMLKLDIEGAEVNVLLDVQDRLDRVQNLFVEYHSYVGEEQRLDEMLSVLRKAGFRLHIKPEIFDEQPFIEMNPHKGMDQ